MFPRIPFPVGFQVCIGHRRYFASDLEGRSEGAAMFSLPGGTCRDTGEYCHLTRWLGLLVRGNTQTMVPPAPARSPLSVSLSPGPGVSAVLSQRAPASPAGHLTMKFEGNERQMEVPVCLCRACLSCSHPLIAHFSTVHLADHSDFRLNPGRWANETHRELPQLIRV